MGGVAFRRDEAEYGLNAENRPTIKLDPANVPEPLRILIPLAEKFGVSDDIMRDDLFSKTPKEELELLKRTFARYDEQLDKWLAGPEAKGPKYSREYIAFSSVRMSI